ncbi:MAG: hypothetical protein RI907_1425, partial [Pseudomonadota bacterium]
DEYHRRVRIGIGNFQALMRHPEYLLRTSWGTALAYVSHKVLRWVAPHLLVLGLALSVAGAVIEPESMWWAAAAAQLVAYLGAAALYGLTSKGVRLPGLLRIVAFLFALNWAFLVGSWRYAAGDYRGSWRRTAR